MPDKKSAGSGTPESHSATTTPASSTSLQQVLANARLSLQSALDALSSASPAEVETLRKLPRLTGDSNQGCNSACNPGCTPPPPPPPPPDPPDGGGGGDGGL
jgi:hypothetical protein